MNSGIGAQLKFLREYRGLSQSELARRTGLTQSAISHIEAGRHEPRLETVQEILGALDAYLSIELNEGREVHDPSGSEERAP